MDANERKTSETISVHSRPFADRYNPDVRSSIANLSSDEVFTPPQLANWILDLLPPELWSDKKAICKFKRYEDASLSCMGINKHQGEDIGLYGTVPSPTDIPFAFANMEE
ncbi:MAG TPA: hypothetical protein PKO36_09375 [Candidatus Hydrogenedentes bacterium]|nr:hypothetical protein [Candidatus Hydrogenedentota bacterium]HOT50781.1 hypothetical protein [Candidatus Hydrogenedentota bacterium]HOV74757.1 hypothetical protein [Candidatus Hydrogenedentota bacterium]HPC17286.1 hypothetical protein [Candidatus Hydrogenedentota bacterium]HRT20441.1 hypothetical protein [Candidatus Hydrogenedentota bacterium]